MTEEELIAEADVISKKVFLSIAEIIVSEQKTDEVNCLAIAEVAKRLLRRCISSIEEDAHEEFLSLVLEYVTPHFTLAKRRVS